MKLKLFKLTRQHKYTHQNHPPSVTCFVLTLFCCDAVFSVALTLLLMSVWYLCVTLTSTTV